MIELFYAITTGFAPIIFGLLYLGVRTKHEQHKFRMEIQRAIDRMEFLRLQAGSADRLMSDAWHKELSTAVETGYERITFDPGECDRCEFQPCTALVVRESPLRREVSRPGFWMRFKRWIW